MPVASKPVQAAYGEIPPRISRGNGMWVGVGLAALAVIGAAVLYFFNPSQSSFYPTCTFYRTTGLLCPGCGSLRALHQLLHGHVVEALRLNLLCVLAVPVAGIIAGMYLFRRLRHEPFVFVVRARWFWCGFGVLVIFGVLRNLPFARTHGLAP